MKLHYLKLFDTETVHVKVLENKNLSTKKILDVTFIKVPLQNYVFLSLTKISNEGMILCEFNFN